MKIGYNKVIIRIKIPTKLAGYNVDRNATTYLNNLEVRTLSFYQDNSWIHFVNIDTLAIDYSITKKVKNEFKDDVVIIYATHTHSSFAGLWKIEGVLKSCESFLGKENQTNRDTLFESIVSSIRKSKDKQSNYKVLYNKVLIDNVCTNRNNSKLKGDNEAVIIEFVTEANEKIMLVNFACHPTVLDGSFNDLSGDIIEYFKINGKEYELISFMNGSAGDISTRYIKKESSHQEAKRLGDQLWKSIQTNNKIETKIPFIEYKENFITLKLKKPKSQEEIEVLKEKAKSKPELDALNAEIEYAKNYLNQESVKVTYQIIDFGFHKFIFLPVEITSELTNIYKKSIKNTSFVSYTNGYMMYLAEKNSYDNYYYESSNSSFMKGEGESLIETLMSI